MLFRVILVLPFCTDLFNSPTNKGAPSQLQLRKINDMTSSLAPSKRTSKEWSEYTYPHHTILKTYDHIWFQKCSRIRPHYYLEERPLGNITDLLTGQTTNFVWNPEELLLEGRSDYPRIDETMAWVYMTAAYVPMTAFLADSTEKDQHRDRPPAPIGMMSLSSILLFAPKSQ